jgi:dTDP-4-amino-4,6-dideoxygalactose transaminase
LLDFLNQAGIAARVYYPHLVSDMAAFKNNTVIGELSNSRELITQVISLPLYPFIKTDEQDYIIDKVAEFFRSL